MTPMTDVVEDWSASTDEARLLLREHAHRIWTALHAAQMARDPLWGGMPEMWWWEFPGEWCHVRA
jgi:hypothetical protein